MSPPFTQRLVLVKAPFETTLTLNQSRLETEPYPKKTLFSAAAVFKGASQASVIYSIKEMNPLTRQAIYKRRRYLLMFAH